MGIGGERISDAVERSHAERGEHAPDPMVLEEDARLPFEVVLAATKDRAYAETAEAALLAAATLVDDARRGIQGDVRMLRDSLYVTENGTYAGILTAFARRGERSI